jgi:electron transfer flavoprotein alpha subunit
MKGEICVVAEALRGEVSEITYVMLAAGRALADALHTRLVVLLVGNEVRKLAGTLGRADRVVCVEHPRLAAFDPEAYLKVVASVFQAGAPRVGLFGHTAIGADLACGVAVRLNLPLATSCRTFAVNGTEPTYSALTCGGKLLAGGPLPGPSCLVTVMPGGYKADAGKIDKAPPIETVAPPADLDAARTRFQRYVDPPAGDVDIAKQPILVSVGRGIQNKDNIALAEELAKAMGGVVSGSRPVIDQAWLPTTRLVGKSGKQVKPRLYLALGISGAPEHAEGMREAELIIAVNRDEKAPIYGFAHYGAAVDVLELIPALTRKLRQMKKA